MCLALTVSCIQNSPAMISCPIRLASQFHHDALHDLENGSRKDPACVVFKKYGFQKMIGIWRDLFKLVSQIPQKGYDHEDLCFCIRTLERKFVSLAEIICSQGMVPSPESIHISVSKSRCSGVLALFRTPPTKMVDRLHKLRATSSSLSSLLQPFRFARGRSHTPSV